MIKEELNDSIYREGRVIIDNELFKKAKFKFTPALYIDFEDYDARLISCPPFEDSLCMVSAILRK